MALRHFDITTPQVGPFQRPRISTPRLPIEEIIKSNSFSPEAIAIKTVGNILAAALAEKAQNRKNRAGMGAIELATGKTLPEYLKRYGDPELTIKAFAVQAALEKSKTPSFVIPQITGEGQVSGFTPLPEGTRPAMAAKEIPPKPELNSRESLAYKKQFNSLISSRDTIRQLRNAWDVLEQKGKTGLNLKTAGTSITGVAQQDPDVRKYDALKNSLVVQIGRNVGGDVGNFTQQEQARYATTMPSRFANSETAKALFDQLEELSNIKINDLNSVYGQGNEKPSNSRIIRSKPDKSNIPHIGESFMGGNVIGIRKKK